MYGGFDKLDTKAYIEVSEILEKVSEEYIWAYYIGNYQVGKLMSAPYRQDKKPSFWLTYDQRGRLMFKDFGVENMYGDIFNFLCSVYSLTLPQACEKINNDLGLKIIKGKKVEAIKKTEFKKLKKIEEEAKRQKLKDKIQVVIRKYEEEDIKYWREFGITYQTLERYFIYCAQKVFLNKKLVYVHSINSPCYVYYFPKSTNVKCYRPFVKENRFFPSNISTDTDIQGYWQCEVKSRKKNKVLVLTKSMKDVMLLRELGVDAMAPHGESHRIPEDFIRHIKKYYPVILLLYDCDRTGIKASRVIWKEHRIPPFFIPKKYREDYCKDISDLYKIKGEEVCRKFIEEMIFKAKTFFANETN